MQTIDTTKAQRARLARDWTAIAKETVTVEQIGATFYGFASELACLRLYYKYRYTDTDTIRVERNPCSGWFFSLAMLPEED